MLRRASTAKRYLGLARSATRHEQDDPEKSAEQEGAERADHERSPAEEAEKYAENAGELDVAEPHPARDEEVQREVEGEHRPAADRGGDQHGGIADQQRGRGEQDRPDAVGGKDDDIRQPVRVDVDQREREADRGEVEERDQLDRAADRGLLRREAGDLRHRPERDDEEEDGAPSSTSG